jgi:hypothetical protein
MNLPLYTEKAVAPYSGSGRVTDRAGIRRPLRPRRPRNAGETVIIRRFGQKAIVYEKGGINFSSSIALSKEIKAKSDFRIFHVFQHEENLPTGTIRVDQRERGDCQLSSLRSYFSVNPPYGTGVTDQALQTRDKLPQPDDYFCALYAHVRSVVSHEGIGVLANLQDQGEFTQGIYESISKETVSAKPVATFFGKVEAFFEDQAVVSLLNEKTGDRLEAECDPETLKKQGISKDDEFRCEVVEGDAGVSVRFFRLPPKRVSAEQVSEIVKEVDDLVL